MAQDLAILFALKIGRGSGDKLDMIDQRARASSISGSSCGVPSMAETRFAVVATEARKDGTYNCCALRIHKPPVATGREAWAESSTAPLEWTLSLLA